MTWATNLNLPKKQNAAVKPNGVPKKDTFDKKWLDK